MNTTRRSERRSHFAEALADVTRDTGRTLRDYSFELTATGLLLALLAALITQPLLICWPLLVLVLTGVYYGRSIVARAHRSARIKRAWRRAMTDVGLADKCTRVKPAAAGQKLTVKVARGRAVSGLEAKSEELAACLEVQEVRIHRDRENARYAKVILVRRDPFLDMPSVPWPGLDENTTPSVWEPVRIGTNEDGEPVLLKLVGNQILVGGTTGAGKSMLMRSVLGTAALDPGARLWLFDAKLIELTPWASVAETLVDDDGDRAVQVLRQLKELTDKRQREIVAAKDGWDKITRASKLPVHVIVVDELGEYATMEQGREIMALLASIARRGRSLGMIVVAATQSPYADVIRPELRTQFKTRIIFRCMDRGHASTIVGNTPIAQLAADINPNLPGVGYTVDESGQFGRFRTVLVTRPDPDDHPDWKDQVAQIIERGRDVRLEAGLAGLQEEPEVSNQTPKGSETRNPPVADASNGNGKPKRPKQTRGPNPEMVALVREHLGPEPIRQSAIAVRLGRHPGDGTVRKVLEHLEGQGQARKTEDGAWIETGSTN